MQVRVLTTTGLLALGLALAAVTPAGAGEAGTVTCKRQAHLEINPPMTMHDAEHTFVERGGFADCVGPGGSGLSGVLNTVGVFRGSCKGGRAESPSDKITWSDGTTSFGHAVADVTVPPVAPGNGRITRGKFADRSFTFQVYLVPADPQLCVTTGVTDVDFFGDWTFR